jgi:hypothetical protein
MAETITQITQPPEFIEAAAKPYLTELQRAVGQFKGQDLSKIMGQQFVAGQDPLQQQAQALAQQGIGGYQPYLQSAGALAGQAAGQVGQAGTLSSQAAGQIGQAGTLAGQASQYMGPNAYQQFMSPYQQDIIDTTLAEYDVQAQKGLPQLAANAIGAGAFGGGREGVQRAEYQSTSDRNRASLQAQLLQQGFGQAQQSAGQAFGQQQSMANQALGLGQAYQGLGNQRLGIGQAYQGLGQEQLGLGGAQQGFLGQDIGALQTFGGINQAQNQAQLQAQQQLLQAQSQQPIQAAQTLGSGIMGLISGYPGGTQQTVQPTPGALQTGLSAASTLAGIYKAFNPTPQNFNFG